ncbi:hypothetical protein K0U83_13550 [bacterium]|nr:hypothetical protein [bacterium]
MVRTLGWNFVLVGESRSVASLSAAAPIATGPEEVAGGFNQHRDQKVSSRQFSLLLVAFGVLARMDT